MSNQKFLAHEVALFLQLQKAEAVKSKWNGVTCVLILTVLVSIIGSCTQFGYNTGVVNNPKGVS